MQVLNIGLSMYIDDVQRPPPLFSHCFPVPVEKQPCDEFDLRSSSTDTYWGTPIPSDKGESSKE